MVNKFLLTITTTFLLSGCAVENKKPSDIIGSYARISGIPENQNTVFIVNSDGTFTMKDSLFLFESGKWSDFEYEPEFGYSIRMFSDEFKNQGFSFSMYQNGSEFEYSLTISNELISKEYDNSKSIMSTTALSKFNFRKTGPRYRAN